MLKLINALKLDCKWCGLPVYIAENKEVYHTNPVCDEFEELMRELEAEAVGDVEAFPLEGAGNG